MRGDLTDGNVLTRESLDPEVKAKPDGAIALYVFYKDVKRFELDKAKEAARVEAAKLKKQQYQGWTRRFFSNDVRFPWRTAMRGPPGFFYPFLEGGAQEGNGNSGHFHGNRLELFRGYRRGEGELP